MQNTLKLRFNHSKKVEVTISCWQARLRRSDRIWFDTTPSEQGLPSPLLPAAQVRCGGSGGFPYAEPLREVPSDVEARAPLPYRPPTPPWDPRLQERRQVLVALKHAHQALAKAIAHVKDIQLASAGGSSGLIALMEAGRARAAAEEQVAVLEEEAAALRANGPPVQAANTTLLGFRVEVKAGRAKHCDDPLCARSKFY